MQEYIPVFANTNSISNSVVETNIPARPIRRVIIKRLNIHGFDPGHWWIEVYSSETTFIEDNLQNSYGWYPFIDNDNDGVQDCNIPLDDDGICYDAVRPGAFAGFKGVEGRLNRGFPFDPQATQLRISWDVDDMFHPMVSDGRTDEEVIECIHNFAIHHRAQWAWPQVRSDEDHCQTFQKKIINHCRLQRFTGPVQR